MRRSNAPTPQWTITMLTIPPREQYLANLLSSIAALPGASRCEIVVIYNASTNEELDTIERRICAMAPRLPVRVYLNSTDPTIGGGRRLQLGVCRTPLIAFVDDDLTMHGAVLGTLEESLKVLRSRLASAGHIVLDTVWTRGEKSKPNVAMSEANTKSAVRAAGFDVVDEELLDPEWVRAQNHHNTEAIRRRARELGRRYPEMQPWFDDYVGRQEEECRQLDEKLACCILLLRAPV